MKVLIIEDEMHAANRLETLLLEVNPEAEVLAKIASVKESINWLNDHSVDLIFADIQLSDGLSFNIFNSVKSSAPIIFTTAYDQYAIKAFEVNSIAYLLKPIRRSELAAGLSKFRDMKMSYQADIEGLMKMFRSKTPPTYKKRFLIRIGDQYRKIEAAELAYCFAIQKEVVAMKFDGHTVPMDSTLDELEKQLDPAIFFRINRRYIVQMNAIERMIALSRSRIKLVVNPKPEDPNDTIVSIQRSAGFKKWMDS